MIENINVNERIIKLTAGVYDAFADFVFVDKEDSRLLLASIFSRDAVLRAITATAQNGQMFLRNIPGKNVASYQIQRIWTENYFSVQNSGAEIVHHGVMKHKKLNDPKIAEVDYLFTTKEDVNESLYDFLMNNYNLPLMREWMENIYLQGEMDGVISSSIELYRSEGGTQTLPLYQKNVPLEDVVILKINISQEWLNDTVSTLLKHKVIRICDEEMRPLTELRSEKANVDTYFGAYGNTVKDNLVNFLESETDFTPVVPAIAPKIKIAKPDQANVIQGATNHLMKHPFVLDVCGMGVGKTLMSLYTVENYFVTKWLRRNPKKTLRDAYMSSNNVNYRVIITCPGHMLEKWKKEVEEVIPYAKAYILREFKQVTRIKKRGYKRHGKEFYILSKDFMKLDSTYRPLPTQIAEKDFPHWKCSSCGTSVDRRRIDVPITRYKCDCGNNHFKRVNKSSLWECSSCGTSVDERKIGVPITRYKCDCGNSNFRHVGSDEVIRGLLCPDCGEVLVKKVGNSFEEMVPADFLSKNTTNQTCFHCGSKLWMQDVSNLDGNALIRRSSKWKLKSHPRSKGSDQRVTSWVLDGYEDAIFEKYNIQRDMVEDAARKKVRKIAPIDYIRRQLKGWFDFTILDELHNFKGGGTAQGIAMHGLVKSAKKAIGLTGTIAGGVSEDLFYLLYRLNPSRMKEYGYDYHKISAFSDVYGSKVAEFSVSDDGYMNKSSRGRLLKAKKSKPGISPLIFGDFLIDNCLFLDITDMGQYIPDLKEEIVLCPCPDEEIMDSYYHVINTLKNEGSGFGITALSSIQLMFSLSYLDKPYQRKAIMHPQTNELIVRPDSHELAKGEYLPKEQKLIDLINQEQAEGRNVFVYCEFTGKEDSKITDRVKQIIEDGCNLHGKVAILESNKPVAAKREKWLKEQAVAGKRVIISNPKCVETGLDFIFEENGITYTYPTLIFYQLGYNLFTLWQASRRHYRLNQTKECRTYYLAYEGTVQQSVISTMAEKQVATSAIQGGSFSAEGLSAMANGVDPRLKLIQALNEGVDADEGKSLQDKFNKLSAKKETYEEYDTSSALTFYELTGLGTDVVPDDDVFNTEDSMLDIFSPIFAKPQKPEIVIDTTAIELPDEKEIASESSVEEEVKSREPHIPQMSTKEFYEDPFAARDKLLGIEPKKTKKKKEKEIDTMQVSLEDFLF